MDKVYQKLLGPGPLKLEFCPDGDGLAAAADSHRDLLRLEKFAGAANRLSGFALGRLAGLKCLAPERCVGVFGLGGESIFSPGTGGFLARGVRRPEPSRRRSQVC